MVFSRMLRDLGGTRRGEPRSSMTYDFCCAEAHEKFYMASFWGGNPRLGRYVN